MVLRRSYPVLFVALLLACGEPTVAPRRPRASTLTNAGVDKPQAPDPRDRLEPLTLPEDPTKPVDDGRFCAQDLDAKATVFTCTDSTVTDLTPLKKLASLQRLTLAVGAENLTPIAHLTKLKTLDIRSTHLDTLSNLKELKSLENLRLDGSGSDKLVQSRFVLTALGEGPSLQTLILSNIALTDLVGIERAKQLTRLDLGGNISLTNRDLGALKSLNKLSFLDLRGIRLESLSTLPTLPALAELRIHDSTIPSTDTLGNQRGLRVLALTGSKIERTGRLARLGQLEVLDLQGSRLSDYRPLRKLRKLRSLDLGATTFARVDYLKKLRNLEVLSLANTPVKRLKGLRRLKKLRQLDISGTKVTRLKYLRRMRALSELTVGDKTRVSAKERAAFEKARPGVIAGTPSTN